MNDKINKNEHYLLEEFFKTFISKQEPLGKEFEKVLWDNIDDLYVSCDNNIIILFLVGQYRSGRPPYIVWDFQGIFSDRKKAEEACKNESYFISEVILNKECPDEDSLEFPNCEYFIKH